MRIRTNSERLGEALRNSFKAAEPPPDLLVSEWSDEYRFLSKDDSAEPGKYRTSRCEPLRGIMDAQNDPTVQTIEFMKPAQIGYTTLLGNVIGYYMDQDPSPMLVIMPTVNTAKSWSKDRLAPMLRDTPQLRGKVKDPRSRDSGNTILHKEFPGGRLTIVGANAPAELASRPIRIVLNDEVDRFPLSASDEGSPQKLAGKRQTTFWNKKTFNGSTPTVKGLSAIEKGYERSDKRRFYVPCEHCHEPQILHWQNVKWDKNDDDEHLPHTAHYQCEHCGTLWTDAERWAAVQKGQWIATAPFNGVAGFHLSQLYSPWVKLQEIVQEFVDAQGKPEELQVFVNTVLAETWEEQGEKVDADGLKARIENYDHFALPDGVWLMTAGVDVQGDRLEIELVGWGEGDENWGVRYEVLYGDPAQAQVWDDLEEVLFDRYWTENGRLVRVAATCVDMGGHHADEVLSFAEKHTKKYVFAVKGQAGARPVWPKRASRSKDRRKMWSIGVDTAKESVTGRFKIKEEGPGYSHLPNTYDDVWFAQATSEQVVTRYREGRPYRVWVLQSGKRNEAFDCRVYAYAARCSLPKNRLKPSSIVIEQTDGREVIADEVLKKRKGRGRRVRSKGI